MPVTVPTTQDKSQEPTTTSATANTAHEVENSSTQSVASSTQQKTKEELEADERYKELIEEEYAKREGGA
jgi:hypothetical protein